MVTVCVVTEGRKHVCELPDGHQVLFKGGVPAAVLLLWLSVSVLCYHCDYCSYYFEISDDTRIYPACFTDREQNGGWPKGTLFRAYFSCRLTGGDPWEQPQGYGVLPALEGLGDPGHWVRCAHAEMLHRWQPFVTSGFIPSRCSSLPCPFWFSTIVTSGQTPRSQERMGRWLPPDSLAGCKEGAAGQVGCLQTKVPV